MRSGSTTAYAVPSSARYAVALAAAACVALAGCTDGGADEPTGTPSASGSGGSSSSSGPASPTSSSSGTPSATPSATASVAVPAAAQAHTEAGAIEFAKFYMLEADKAYVTVDSSVIEALAGPDCENCTVAVDGVRELAAAGRRQTRPALQVLATNPLPGATADSRQVQVQTRAQSVNVVDKAGKVVDTTDSAPAVYLFALRWSGDGWVVGDFGIES